MSEEEKVKIRKQHKDATKEFYQKKADEKKGLKPVEKPKKETSKKK